VPGKGWACHLLPWTGGGGAGTRIGNRTEDRAAPGTFLNTVGPSLFDALNSAGLLSAKGANAPYVKFPVLRLDSGVLIPCLLWH